MVHLHQKHHWRKSFHRKKCTYTLCGIISLAIFFYLIVLNIYLLLSICTQASPTTNCHISVSSILLFHSHFLQFLCTTGLSALFFVSLGLPWRWIQLVSLSVQFWFSPPCGEPWQPEQPCRILGNNKSRVRADKSRINGPPKLGGRRWGNNPPHKDKHVQNHQQHALGCRTDSTKYSNYILTVSEC